MAAIIATFGEYIAEQAVARLEATRVWASVSRSRWMNASWRPNVWIVSAPTSVS